MLNGTSLAVVLWSTFYIRLNGLDDMMRVGVETKSEHEGAKPIRNDNLHIKDYDNMDLLQSNSLPKV